MAISIIDQSSSPQTLGSELFVEVGGINDYPDIGDHTWSNYFGAIAETFTVTNTYLTHAISSSDYSSGYQSSTFELGAGSYSFDMDVTQLSDSAHFSIHNGSQYELKLECNKLESKFIITLGGILTESGVTSVNLNSPFTFNVVISNDKTVIVQIWQGGTKYHEFSGGVTAFGLVSWRSYLANASGGSGVLYITSVSVALQYTIMYQPKNNGTPIGSPIVTTDTTFNYTPAEVGNWTFEATSAETTVESSIIEVVEAGNTYKPLDSYSVRLDMAMTIRRGFNDTISIFDDGSGADTYTTTAQYYAEDYNIWGAPQSNDTPVILSEEGFSPFGSHFLGDQTGYRYYNYTGKGNFHGEYQLWNAELIPDSSGGYSYDTTTYTPCTVTGFAFDGVDNVPMPNCIPSSEYNIIYGRIGNVTREYDRGISTIPRRFRMQWNSIESEELRIILIRILTNIRGNSFLVNFYDGFNRFSPWQPRGSESTTGTQLLRLVSPVIEYTYSNSKWNLSIEVMKWQE